MRNKITASVLGVLIGILSFLPLAAVAQSAGNMSGGAGAYNPLALPVTVPNGGTGAAALTGNGAVIMNSGGTAMSTVAPGSNGNVLTSNGSAWTSAAAGGGGGISTTGPLPDLTISGGNIVANHKLTDIRIFMKDENSTSLGINLVGFGLDGTGLTGSGTWSTVLDADGYWMKFTTGAVSTNTAGYSFGGNLKLPNGQGVRASFKTGSAAENLVARLWTGYNGTASQGAFDATDSPTTNCAVLRRSTVTSDVNFQFVTSNGTTNTITDTGIAYAADTEYEYFIDMSNTSSFKLYMSSGGAALPTTPTLTVTTTLPPTGASGGAAMIRIITNEAVAKACKFRSMDYWTK